MTLAAISIIALATICAAARGLTLPREPIRYEPSRTDEDDARHWLGDRWLFARPINQPHRDGGER